jgi:lysophospholipase L1-like esterase
MITQDLAATARKPEVVGQLLFGVAALMLAWLPGLPWISVTLLGLSLVSGLAATLMAVSSRGDPTATTARTARTALRLRRITWTFLGSACVTAVWARETFAFWDTSVAAIAWLMAASFFMAHLATRDMPGWSWLKGVAWMWAAGGVLVWLGTAYLRDHAPTFYIGLVLLLGLGVALRWWFRLSPTGTQAVNTLILLTIALPLTDRFVAASRSAALLTMEDRPYAFDTVGHDPGRFAAWWRHYQEAWDRMGRDIFMPDPDGELPLRLRPGSEGQLMQSRIVINQAGFRGRELDNAQPGPYRILALGESTTFGCTLLPDDLPWPDLLEEIIRERLRPQRPVQVINAGVPAYTLAHNVQRFEQDLFPLRPDLVVSYHGYNGFPLLREAIPPVAGGLTPAYRKRPLVLLAQFEYRLRQLKRQHRPSPEPSPQLAGTRPLLETSYADRYQDLIRLTDMLGAQLVLCTFAMAVDRQSADQVVDFYRSGFPAVRWQIAANEAHSKLLRKLQSEHPQVLLIDIGSVLNGRHDHYIDLVHLTQEGRERIAETLFDRLSPLLRAELAEP